MRGCNFLPFYSWPTAHRIPPAQWQAGPHCWQASERSASRQATALAVPVAFAAFLASEMQPSSMVNSRVDSHQKWVQRQALPVSKYTEKALTEPARACGTNAAEGLLLCSWAGALKPCIRHDIELGSLHAKLPRTSGLNHLSGEDHPSPLSVRPSVPPSVRPSVRRSVGQSVVGRSVCLSLSSSYIQ